MNESSQAKPIEVMKDRDGASVFLPSRTMGEEDGHRLLVDFYSDSQTVHLSLGSGEITVRTGFTLNYARHLRDALIALELGER